MTDYSVQVAMITEAVTSAAHGVMCSQLSPRLQIAAQLLAGHMAAGKLMVTSQAEVKQALTVAEALIYCEKDMK